MDSLHQWARLLPETSAMTAFIFVLFLLSGISGLIYEVLWAKQLILVLGNTALAHTLVLCVFMGGLSLGSAILGARSDSARSPLRFYGFLELGIALFGFLSPFLLGVISSGYISLAGGEIPVSVGFGLKLIVCGLVLLPPAALMGGTLPVLSRFIIRSLSQTEKVVSTLYFINSAGASLGALLAGFWLVPTFGLNWPVYGAAACNLVIGLCALGLAQWLKTSPAPAAPANSCEFPLFTPDIRQLRILYGAVFLSGLLALAYEVAWIRLLSILLGSSAYSFSLMLSAFIAGIALGSLLVRKLAFPRLDSYIHFGLAQAGIGLSILLTLPVYGKLPYYLYLAGGALNRTSGTFYLYQTYQFLLCFILMLLPTLFMGMTLPLASASVTDDMSRIGKNIGKVFGLNGLGNVLGALAAGLFLLPWLGLQRLIEAGILLNLLISCIVLYTSSLRAATRAAIVAATVGAALLTTPFWGPGWNKLILSAGEFRGRLYYEPLSYSDYKRKFSGQSLLYYKDDSDATIAVFKENGDIFLKTNGKTDASIIADRNTEILSAHIPLLLKPEAKDVLVVGLGSGITAGSALTHPISSLDVVEISRAVVSANRFFADHNNHALEDPRLRLNLDDAKTFLKLSPRRYDLIISEPSNPWIAGVGNLFSVDFYHEAKARLTAGGAMVQWFHLYEMRDETLKLILRTFCSQFDHVILWEIPPSKGDILLIGSQRPFLPDFGQTEKELKRPAVSRDLFRIGISRLPTLLSLQTASNPTIRSLAGIGRINEDQFPVLEYEAPKALFLRETSDILYSKDERLKHGTLEPLLLTDYLRTRGSPLSPDEFQELADFPGKFHGMMQTRFLEEWARRYPSDLRPCWALAQAKMNEGDGAGALVLVEELLQKKPDNPAYLDMAAKLALELFLKQRSYLTEGSPQKALAYLRRLAQHASGASKIDAYQRISEIYANTGTLLDAQSYIEKAANSAGKDKSGPSPDNIWVAGAQMALDRGNKALAADCLNKALKINPGNTRAGKLLKRANP